jgi:ferric-dicitrate binding protein FerR (iron transport regulator)
MKFKKQSNLPKSNQVEGKAMPQDFREMEFSWENVDSYKDDYPKPDLEKLWKGTKQKLGWIEEKRIISMRRKILRVAAAIAIPLLFVGVAIYYSVDRVNTNKGLISFISPEGVRTRLDLPDGSVVWLQPNSEIKYPKEFDPTKRQVFFSGQAYFDITHNPYSPFIVSVKNLKINVLGTKFYVKAKSSNDHIETGLISGKVNLTGEGFEKTLLVNEVVIFSSKRNSIIETRSLQQNAFEWNSNSMVFSNCDLGTLLNNISDWYGLECYIDPKIDVNKKITITIREESIQEIAEILKIVVPFEYKISENRIVYTLGKQQL